MSTFLKHKIRLPQRLRLNSKLAVALAVLLYSCLAHLFFSPPTVEIPQTAGSSVLFSTDVDTTLRPSMERAILDAKQSILLIIYSLSDPSIVNALTTAAQKGVDVTVIHDLVETPDAHNLLGKKVTCYGRRNRGLMHNKLLVIDHTSVWIGSANLSTRSLTEQGNLVVAMNCPALAAAIEQVGTTMVNRSPFKMPPCTIDSTSSRWTVYFHPWHGKQSLHDLLSRIDRAANRVFVAMFTFTHPDLVSALCRAKERGVDVRVILDQESSQRTSRAAFVRFKRKKIPCGYRTKSGLLHYKAAIIDDLFVGGSCNWTRAGFTSNHEALFLIDPIPEDQKAWIDNWWKTVERSSSLHGSSRKFEIE